MFFRVLSKATYNILSDVERNSLFKKLQQSFTDRRERNICIVLRDIINELLGLFRVVFMWKSSKSVLQ